ncbi:hypothetical protein T492DRAFT_1102637 [Pavlovales sp. CCMP2436]|nr:hypothetical protein T492DRAFT_1102637 [Pavlovales sp. CCMP2436]|mmetsp:Transcript_5082/g.13169  ORF Transcript_5082/g.13169 Transcript_5082/m.13169 type:complete len:174 (-) Transcript_5082:227-748(-)
MASTAWGAMFQMNKDDARIAERIRAFDRPQRRGAQPVIPGPVYERVIRGEIVAPVQYPTLAKPYPWLPAVPLEERYRRPEAIVGYIGHRPRKREAFSQSTFMPLNQRAAVMTDPWQSTHMVNFTGHHEEVTRLAQSRSQNLSDRSESMRTMSAAASLNTARSGSFPPSVRPFV